MGTATASRSVRIRLAMKDSPISRAIRQSLSPVFGDDIAYVDNTGDADLVIFMSARDIARDYDKDKPYVCLMPVGQPKESLPPNCTVIGVESAIVDLTKAVIAVRTKLAGATPEPAEEAVPLRPDALHILVVDDTPVNIASARKSLAGHRLFTAIGYDEAMGTLATLKFDVVLTDLHLPMSPEMLGPDAFRFGELVPYGILLMIEAARRGAKHVAVVTDLSHHADAFSAAFDHFSQFSVRIEAARVMMMHAPLLANGAKDWAEALERLMA